MNRIFSNTLVLLAAAALTATVFQQAVTVPAQALSAIATPELA